MSTTLLLAGTVPAVSVAGVSAVGWWRASRAAARLRARLHTDPLTGLVNRDGLTTHLHAATAEAVGESVGLLLLDLDHFKQVNDRYGHAEGNTVLRHVAAQLAAVCRAGGVPVRLHGDEFAVLLPSLPAGQAGHLAAMDRAITVRAAIASPLVTTRTCHTVTATVGAAVQPRVNADLSRLLAEADAAMYTAKPHHARSITHTTQTTAAASAAGRRNDP